MLDIYQKHLMSIQSDIDALENMPEDEKDDLALNDAYHSLKKFLEDHPMMVQK